MATISFSNSLFDRRPRRTIALGFGLILCILPTRGAFAQQASGGESPRLAPEVAARRYSKTVELLHELDTNGDGVIDENDSLDTESGPHLLQQTFLRLGLEPRLPVTIDALQQALAVHYQIPSVSPSGRTAEATAPNVPPTPSVPAVAGFGTLREAARAPVAAPASDEPTPDEPSPPAAFDNAALESKLHELAAALMKQFDLDGDGVLDRDEWPSASRWGAFSEIGRTHTDYVTFDEISLHLRDRYSREPFPLSSGDADSASDRPSARKSHRFLSPHERWPKDLPDWFRNKDLDGDGQVSMAEFSTTWTATEEQEFARYDLNHDGLITPAECLKAARKSANSR
jgi:hypothetical protein